MQAIADRIVATPQIGQAEDISVASGSAIEDNEEEPNDEIDKFEPTAPDADVLPQPQASSAEGCFAFRILYILPLPRNSQSVFRIHIEGIWLQKSWLGWCFW